MSFWGLNDAGSQAKGFPGELGNWQFGQYKDWLAKQNQYGQTADPLVQQAISYWNTQKDAGAPSVATTQATGKEILDVDPTSQAIIDRSKGLMDEFGNLTPASTTYGNLQSNLRQSGADINTTGTAVSSEINDTATRMADRNEASSRDIIQNILDTYGTLGEQTNDTFYGLRDANKLTYEDLLKASTGAYGNAFQELEKMRPGGDFAAATAARAFAPETARVMSSLRRAGTDMNSPEASAALGGVGEAKARAMDDAFGRNASDFSRQAIDLNLSKFGAESGIKNARLANETALATGQLGETTRLGETQLSGVTGQKGKATDAAQVIDESRKNDQISNMLNSLGLRSDWWDKMNATDVAGRQMEREDLTTKGKLTENMNAADMNALNLKLEQFGLGKNFLDADQATKDKAMANLMGISDQQYANMFKAGASAQGSSNSALQAFLTSFGLQNADAGWGAKLLANLGFSAGMAALEAYAPWAVPILEGVQGKTTGGGGGGGGGATAI